LMRIVPVLCPRQVLNCSKLFCDVLRIVPVSCPYLRTLWFLPQ